MADRKPPAVRLETAFQSFRDEDPTDLLAHVISLVPEEYEVHRVSAYRHLGLVYAVLQIAATPEQGEEIAALVRNATGLPSRDVSVRHNGGR